ncbi:GNAT family N-acetyltransferase [Rurimicrobium arvi]|uniref:N-acetyltransferase domain-containing protein n=1 Tax=Rurimicrobium arvi TaxID=2049916 RepID=A0ABP8MJM5_9BACT
MSSTITLTRIDARHPLFPEVFALRDTGLRKPLGQSLYEEDTSGDLEDDIFIAQDGARIIGCLMAKPLPGQVIKLRQMIVDSAFQGKGIGRELMQAAEAFVRSNGAKQIMLHARNTAIPFYEKLGYAVHGDTFEEVGIPHKLMSKEL